MNSAFPSQKNLPKNRSLFMRNETKSKCLPKFYVSSKQDKEYYRKTTPYLEQRAAMSAVRSCEGNDWTFNGSTWELPCLKILERSIITFFFFFQLQNGFRTSFLLSSRLSRFTTEFSRFMFGQKNKNKKKAALKSVFDIDFNKPLLIQQKYSFAIAIDLVVISKEVKRLYINSNES